MSNSLIPSFIKRDVSESLRLLMTKERLWANRSGRSLKMSDHERFTQVAHQKWATMSKSLRSLTKNEQITHFLSQSLIHPSCHKKRVIHSENRWANSQPCFLADVTSMQKFPYYQYPASYTLLSLVHISCSHFLALNTLLHNAHYFVPLSQETSLLPMFFCHNPAATTLFVYALCTVCSCRLPFYHCPAVADSLMMSLLCNSPLKGQ